MTNTAIEIYKYLLQFDSPIPVSRIVSSMSLNSADVVAALSILNEANLVRPTISTKPLGMETPQGMAVYVVRKMDPATVESILTKEQA